MKDLLLATYANRIYRDKLDSRGFNVMDFGQPLTEDALSVIKKSFKGTAIIEIIEESMPQLDKMIEDLRKRSVRIIALAAKINDNFRAYFLKHGISEVLESNNSERLASYVDITGNNGNKRYGKIIIFDDNTNRIDVLKTIISRFNYSPDVYNSIDDLFANLSGINIQLLFLNLGTKDFDLNYFLRKSYASDIIKKILIPYKDESEGIYIHEMISGLNRIARVILTTDEVYSFLVDILFRKELSPGVSLLNETLDYDNLKFTNETLSRIYSSMGSNIFSMKKIITKDNIDIIDGRIESLKNMIIKVDGLKWLIRNDTEKCISGGTVHKT